MNVRTSSWLLIGALCAAAACSDEASTLADAALDATIVRADAAPSRPDAAPAADAEPADATTPDAAPLPDAEPARDADPADSGVVPDAGESTPDASAAPDASAPSCGALASPCNDSRECGGQGLECVDPPGLCMPVMPTCGGFVMAQCPGLTPVCLYYRGADYGPCLTADQRLCICSDPVRRQYFPGC